MKINKKGIFGLQELGTGIVTLVIVLAVGAVILSNMGSISGLSTNATYIINNGQNAMSPIVGTWLPIIVLAVVASIIIGLVVRSFRGG